MKTEVRLKDVIRIIDEDILNAMAYTLYDMTYKQVGNSNQKEYSDFIDEFMEEVELKSKGKSTVINYSIAGFDIATRSKIDMLCHTFNNWSYSRYITDTFLVKEVYNDYFKICFLNEYSKYEFHRVGKLEEITNFLNELKFPYDWEYKKFFRMGCAFNKIN